MIRKDSLLNNIIVPKGSTKYKPKYIPVSNISFKNEESCGIGKNTLNKVTITEYADNLKKQGNKTTKGGIFQLLSEEDE